MTTQLNLQMEFINYTWNEVFYYEDLERGASALEVMQDENPDFEIGVSHFSIDGIDVPYNQTNVDFIMMDDDALQTIQIASAIGLDMIDLYDTKSVIETHYGCYHFTGYNDLDCFIEMVNEFCLIDIPSRIEPYFDYERLYRDYEFDGMATVEVEDGYIFII